MDLPTVARAAGGVDLGQVAHGESTQTLFLLVGVAIAALQGLTVLILNWLRGEIRDVKASMTRGSDRMSRHEVTLSDHDARLRLIERDHDRNHGPFVRRSDPPDMDPSTLRCHEGERQG